jgi:uncharacterized short protein YbdD (DUF466 family)
MLKELKLWIRKMNGDLEYKKYLNHLEEKHSKKNALSKKDFFAKKEKDNWGKINRCC